MPALHLYAGQKARQHLQQNGLQPQHVRLIAGAAGGPKGLVLGALDRFIFGSWLAQSTQTVDLIGASIGAWRMAAACLNQPVAAFEQLEHDYIHQQYDTLPGRRSPTAKHVSERFGAAIGAFFAGRVGEVLDHPRYRLHLVTTRGRHILSKETQPRLIAGYLGAILANSLRRRLMGYWLERVVFSSRGTALPFIADDYPTRSLVLNAANFCQVMRASCAIPFVLKAICDIPGAPAGAYFDGGITDYHLHLNYNTGDSGIVLYPHFQKALVPGWLDKPLRWRHHATQFLDNVLVLAPDPAWVDKLPNGKLPDRSDFARYGKDLAARHKAWRSAVQAGAQLQEEFAQWLEKPDMARIEPL